MTTLEKPVKITKQLAHEIYLKADAAGKKAAEEVAVPKFIVGDAIGLSNQIDYSRPTYVLEGLCGFAWIDIHPARGAFVNYLKSWDIGSKGYRGGWQIWVSGFGQSIDRKSAYAGAFAGVLREYGITAYAGSRLD